MIAGTETAPAQQRCQQKKKKKKKKKINQAPKYIKQRVKLEQSWRDTQVKTLSEAYQYWLRHHPEGRYLSQY